MFGLTGWAGQLLIVVLIVVLIVLTERALVRVIVRASRRQYKYVFHDIRQGELDSEQPHQNLGSQGYELVQAIAYRNGLRYIYRKDKTAWRGR